MKGTRFTPVLALLALFTALVFTGCSTAVENDQGSHSQGYNKHDFVGQSQAYGDGSVRSFVDRKGHDRPVSVGIILTEKALSGLPTDPDPMDPAKHRVLELPEEAGEMPFDHIFLNWNPAGHEPPHVWDLPHFDIHFYFTSSAAREAIGPADPNIAIPPASQYLPAGFIGGAPIPQMGLHWFDPAAPEFHGTTFTSTFLFGSYNGHVTFMEPMITKAFIESVKSAKGKKVTFDISQPQDYENPGFYPSKYSVSYNPGKKEYTIAVEGFKYWP